MFFVAYSQVRNFLHTLRKKLRTFIGHFGVKQSKLFKLFTQGVDW